MDIETQTASEPAAEAPEAPSGKVAGVPRRFGIGRLMLITTFFSALFAVLSCLKASLAHFVIVPGLFVFVGLAQAVLFSGKSPRKASFVAGAGLFGLLFLAGSAWDFVALAGAGHGIAAWVPIAAYVLFVGAIVAVVGGCVGYAVGCLIAGVFLGGPSVSAETEDRTDDPFAPDDPESTSSADPPPP
jgi:predicted secreted protein